MVVCVLHLASRRGFDLVALPVASDRKRVGSHEVLSEQRYLVVVKHLEVWSSGAEMRGTVMTESILTTTSH